ncbi:GGDEF domain-containing protein [Ammoniphilus sp. CFH 90114]|uniref:GGDEF domain-containing protein n=1 Tax=Ammoniphilus sp. CFH 90114 TaxID=2493665 RepID=UPI00100F7DBF|nr:GGDEF domain-containing protein [Ammoniphilus sp. CFH 90114]RXT03924.1 GGDEF domain-containing protein [Ammoniphilus sp. CFH 90114]
MKYFGRVSLAVIAFFSWTLLIFYYYYVHGNVDEIYVLVAIIYILVGWWLGKQYDKAKFYSEKDPLTQAYNRRYILEKLPKLFSTVDRRKNESISVLVIDVDRFKEINDTFGHQKGDVVLRSIAATLRRNIRRGDYVIRWGGDEFLIVTPNTSKDNILPLINRIERELSETSKQLSLTISISIGVANYPQDSTDFNELIKIADNNMYLEKEKKKKSCSI